MPRFPLYQLQHNFCTRLSAVAADAVVQQAMRHFSAETKRHYHLGMTEQVRERIEDMNKQVYGQDEVCHSYDSGSDASSELVEAARN